MFDKNIVQSFYPDLNPPTRHLLGPGPSLVHPKVLRAMSTPLLGYMDPAFFALMDQIKTMLQLVFETRNSLTLPISGTGSAAMETTITNIIEEGDPMLVCVNGFFGLRQAEMARRYGANVEVIHAPWGQVFFPSVIDITLKASPAKVVAIVQAETSTGALQPLAEIADVVHKNHALLLVDAVTSLGGVPVSVDKIGIDLAYSGSQKCLSCPPGLGPVTISPQAEELISNRRTPVSNWYLDLNLLKKYWGNERVYHHTPPTSMLYGLFEGLKLVLEEGLEVRWERHLHNARLLWEGLAELGLECFVEEAYRLPSLTTVRIPEGLDDIAVRQRLINEFNIEIAGGLGELKGKIWRIGLMGYSSSPENIIMLLGALQKILKR